MTKKVFVIGVGMTKFERPKPLVEYTDLGKEAVLKSLNDCKLGKIILNYETSLDSYD